MISSIKFFEISLISLISNKIFQRLNTAKKFVALTQKASEWFLNFRSINSFFVLRDESKDSSFLDFSDFIEKLQTLIFRIKATNDPFALGFSTCDSNVLFISNLSVKSFRKLM